MTALIWAIGATVIVSLLSLLGIISLSIKEKLLQKMLLKLVGFSAGALMGGAFLHLIPEAIEVSTLSFVGLSVLIGFAAFFIIERFLYWHHCHEGKCDVHTFTYMSLIGDSIHNLIDGLVIAASFVINIPLGIATTIAVITHEIPQELGDFAILVYGGFSKLKALLFNFLTAIMAIVGAIVGVFLSSSIENFTAFLIPFAAGGFIYIAASDLVPELHKESKLNQSIMSFVFFLVGIALMLILKVYMGG
ncbi:MAG: ZIP family metal transporter [Candidatus Woesearchaeota archaeon]